MSISLMTEAWKLQDLSSTQKFVFMSLADNANDQGECYPSMALIVRRTCLSERAVRDAIRALESKGYVRSVSRLGTSTMYHLSTAPAAAAPPAPNAPRQEMPPRAARAAPPPRQEVPPTPAAAAPKPSINPQVNRQLTVKDATALLPDWLPTDAWEMYDRFRTKKSGKGWTGDAKRLALRNLEKLRELGHDPAAVIEQSVMNGWAGLFELKNQTRTNAQGQTLNRQEALEASNRAIAERLSRTM